jgi:hypothetical protein
MPKKRHRKVEESETEHIQDIENELNEIESEHNNDSDHEEYDSELEKEEAQYIKKHNIQKKNLFEED